MNKYISLMLLGIMLSYNVIVKRNEDNTTTVSHDHEGGWDEPQFEPMTVPNSIYESCNLITQDEAWDLNSLVNKPIEEGNEFLDDMTDVMNKKHVEEEQMVESVGSQYDPTDVIN